VTSGTAVSGSVALCIHVSDVLQRFSCSQDCLSGPPYGASVQTKNEAPPGEGDSSPEEDIIDVNSMMQEDIELAAMLCELIVLHDALMGHADAEFTLARFNEKHPAPWLDFLEEVICHERW